MLQRSWNIAVQGALGGLVAVALSLPLLSLTQGVGQLLPAPSWYALSVILDALLAYSPMWLILAILSYRLASLEGGVWLVVGAAAGAYLLLPLVVGTNWSLAAWIWSQPTALMAQVFGTGLGIWLTRR